MYKCRNTTVCIHPSQRCDGTYDCPLFDDEDYCDICPPGCVCFGYSYDCPGMGHAIFKSNLRNIVQLRMKHNSLQNITVSVRNVKLLYLNLESGEINYISPRVFQYVNNLEILNLRNNRLTLIRAETFWGLHRLKTLDVQGNYLTLTSGSFQGLSSLQALDLAQSNITIFDPNLFKGLDSLISLSLSNCSLHQIEPDALRYLGKLNSLNMTHNPLAGQIISKLKILKQLKRLYTQSVVFCCVAGLENGECTPSHDEFSSCSNLVRHVPLKYFTLIIALCGIIFNSYKSYKTLNALRYTRALAANRNVWYANLYMMNVLYGSSFLLLGSADLKLEGVVYQQRDSWTHTIACRLIRYVAAIAYQITIHLLFSCTCLTVIKRNIGFKTSSLDFWTRVSTTMSWIVGLLVAFLLTFAQCDNAGHHSCTGICMTHLILTKSAVNPMIYCNFFMMGICFTHCLHYYVGKMSRQVIVRTPDATLKHFASKFAFPVILPWILVEAVGELNVCRTDVYLCF